MEEIVYSDSIFTSDGRHGSDIERKVDVWCLEVRASHAFANWCSGLADGVLVPTLMYDSEFGFSFRVYWCLMHWK